MAKRKFLIAMFLAVAIVIGGFGVSQAGWLVNWEINKVTQDSTGVLLRCNKVGQTWNSNFRVAVDNQNEILAVALTAMSSTSTVELEVDDVTGEVIGLGMVK